MGGGNYPVFKDQVGPNGDRGLDMRVCSRNAAQC